MKVLFNETGAPQLTRHPTLFIHSFLFELRLKVLVKAFAIKWLKGYCMSSSPTGGTRGSLVESTKSGQCGQFIKEWKNRWQKFVSFTLFTVVYYAFLFVGGRWIDLQEKDEIVQSRGNWTAIRPSELDEGVCCTYFTRQARGPKMMIREMGQADCSCSCFSSFYLILCHFSFIAYCSRKFDSFVYHWKEEIVETFQTICRLYFNGDMITVNAILTSKRDLNNLTDWAWKRLSSTLGMRLTQNWLFSFQI